MDAPEPTKRCRAECGRRLPLSEFYRNREMPDGRLNVCKRCVEARKRKAERAKPKGFYVAHLPQIDFGELEGIR